MSGRFPEGGGLPNGGLEQMSERSVDPSTSGPGGGAGISATADSTLEKLVESTVEELSPNPYSNFLHGLGVEQDNLETDFDRLNLLPNPSVGPVCPPSSSVHHSPGADWRPTSNVQDVTWTPFHFNPLGDQVNRFG